MAYTKEQLDQMTDEEVMAIANQMPSRASMPTQKPSMMQGLGRALLLGGQGFATGKIPEEAFKTSTNDYDEIIKKLEIERQFKEAYPTPEEQVARKKAQYILSGKGSGQGSGGVTVASAGGMGASKTVPSDQSGVPILTYEEGLDEYGNPKIKSVVEPGWEAGRKKSAEARVDSDAKLMAQAPDLALGLKTIDDIISSPITKETSGYGWMKTKLPGKEMYSGEKLKQTINIASLLAASKIKGQGPITEGERSMLKSAQTALSGWLPYEDKIKELNIIRDIMKKSAERAVGAGASEEEFSGIPSEAPQIPEQYNEGDVASNDAGEELIFMGGQWIPRRR